MKKLILSIVFSAVAFSSFAMQATVVSAKGKAEAQNGGNWVALKAGDVIEQGAVIQTGFKSELVLKIKESTVTVAALSRLTLQTLAEREGVNGAAGKDETSIKLATGSLKSNVQKSQDRRVGFTVRSPVATASVRGTDFLFKTRFRGTALSTNAGIVAFWKNTRASERAVEAILEKIAETPVEATEETGTEATDISQLASLSAITVSEGQSASVSSNASGTITPEKTAHAEANSVGDGTKTAAAAEIGVQDATSSSDAGSKTSAPAGFGSLVIPIVLPE